MVFLTTPPPGGFLGLPGGSLREGNELREERDGTKEEAHACDPKGSADITAKLGLVSREPESFVVDLGTLWGVEI